MKLEFIKEQKYSNEIAFNAAGIYIVLYLCIYVYINLYLYATVEIVYKYIPVQILL